MDAFIEREVRGSVDFIKMDVQGAEGRVLHGASRALTLPNLAMLVEFWLKGLPNYGSDPRGVLELLDGRGFKTSS